MPLNDIEILVLATKTMRFTDAEALAYIKSKTKEISKSTYYRILGRIDVETRKRLYDICKNFASHHLERIDTLREIEKELWRNYHMTKTIPITTREDGFDENDKKYSRTTQSTMEMPQSPLEKARILKDITEMQPYISAYLEATQSIMEKSIKEFGNQENIDLSTIGF